VVDCSKVLVNHTVKTVFQPLLARPRTNGQTADDDSVSCVQVCQVSSYCQDFCPPLTVVSVEQSVWCVCLSGQQLLNEMTYLAVHPDSGYYGNRDNRDASYYVSSATKQRGRLVL